VLGQSHEELKPTPRWRVRKNSIEFLVVMNQLDPINEIYNMYLEEENTPRIVEVIDDRVGFDLDLEDGLADLYLRL